MCVFVLCVCVVCVCACMHACVCACMPECMGVCVCMHKHLCAYLSVCRATCLSTCLPLCLSTLLPACLFKSISTIHFVWYCQQDHETEHHWKLGLRKNKKHAGEAPWKMYSKEFSNYMVCECGSCDGHCLV